MTIVLTGARMHVVASIHLGNPYTQCVRLHHFTGRLSMDESTMVGADPCFLPQNAISGFQVFQTCPAKSGPGLSVAWPGVQPAGITSPVSRTCWNACT